MDKDNVIEVINLSKKFSTNIKSSKAQLKNIFVDTLFGWDKSSPLQADEFYALEDISFSIKKNENVAIIGSNGSGKSTLLKILNGIYTPDMGEVEIKGKVGSVLELSSGFKSELSGRENIYLKFALQGIQKEEVDLIIDDVIAFSELEDFMQTPLKHYSSGMKSKLGFAIVSSVNPDILILDEVFAAGDKKFREKSEKRIRELYKNSTMILVTHSMSIVKDIADRVIVLNKGKLVFDGNPQKGITFYENMLKPNVIPKKVFSPNRYGVITAVNNAQDYLEDYFECLINQTLDFEEHIFLTLVDDGSTDNSAQIILAYQKRYPKNITYIKQKKSGIAAARNNGMKDINTPWVTFIDSDDMVNKIYFEEVDKCVVDDNEISVVSCNQIYYIDDTATMKNTNLANRFANEKKVINPKNMQFFIEVSANSVFLKTSMIKKNNLYFDEKIVPVFESACFINELFIKENSINIAFIKKAEYYYRKKNIDSIPYDNSWLNRKRYLDAIEYGLLSLLVKASEQNIDSVYLQRYVLYQIQLYFKKFIEHEEDIKILSKEDSIKFQSLLAKIFSFIDSKTIELSAFHGLTHKYKIGYYKLYKENIIITQMCYIDSYCEDTKKLELHYYFSSENQELFLCNKEKLNILTQSVLTHKFFDKIFVFEKKVTLLFEGKWNYFDAFLSSVETDISYKSKIYKNGIQLNDIIKG